MTLTADISLWIHILRYWVGLRRTLPAGAINRIRICETNEPMIDIRNDDVLFLADALAMRDAVHVRRGVYDRLRLAARNLPDGYYIKVMSAHRTIDEQTELWNRQMAKTRAENPGLSDDALIRVTRRFVAQPHHGFGGHQTGGAVDVTLCDRDGNDLGLGKWLYSGPEIKRADVKRLRRMLRRAMCDAGFVNYPAEWWHFCYGDRMWAAYTRHRECMYGLIERVPQK